MIEKFEDNMTQKPEEAMKKEWKAPEMTQLNVKETKGGKFAWDSDSGSWFPNLQS